VKILVLNNKSETLKELLGVLESFKAAYDVRQPMESLNLKAYAGLIVSGGSIPGKTRREHLEWYCRLYGFAEIPVLAICLGLRILGYCHGCRMKRLSPSEIGLTWIRFFREYPLAPGKSELLVYENHDYELLDLKGPFENYASAEVCKIQAVKHRFKPFFAVQFHPEVGEGNEGPLIIENFVKLCKRLTS
jgi:GMP synthase (glutamine-hydrolysing)